MYSYTHKICPNRVRIKIKLGHDPGRKSMKERPYKILTNIDFDEVHDIMYQDKFIAYCFGLAGKWSKGDYKFKVEITTDYKDAHRIKRQLNGRLICPRDGDNMLFSRVGK